MTDRIILQDRNIYYIFISGALTYLFILTVKCSVENSTNNQLPSLHISSGLKLTVCTEGGSILSRSLYADKLNRLYNHGSLTRIRQKQKTVTQPLSCFPSQIRLRLWLNLSVRSLSSAADRSPINRSAFLQSYRVVRVNTESQRDSHSICRSFISKKHDCIRIKLYH